MRRFIWKGFLAFELLVAAGVFLFATQHASSQSLTLTRARDPGVRTGAPGAGGPIAGLTGGQQAFFEAGKDEFVEAEEVDEGLGPRMNLDSCGGCHAQPEIGGSSPAVNPQFEFATSGGATDKVPSFIRADGPVREARFVRNADGSPDGGVAALFTISGRDGAVGCQLAQPDFAGQLARRNVIFRIPTPVFGAGLIEQIEDNALLANQAANSSQKSQLGIRGRANTFTSGRTISGVANRNGNDGTITRFGWKAQNVTLLVFSGEAYNVEMGITSELFQNEREQNPALLFRERAQRRPEHGRLRRSHGRPGSRTSPTSSASSRLRRRPRIRREGRSPSRGGAVGSSAPGARSAIRPRSERARPPRSRHCATCRRTSSPTC